MTKLLLTYLLGVDYEESFYIDWDVNSLENVKEILTNVLLPVSVQVKDQDNSIVFKENIYPRFSNEFRQIYFVYKIESSISNTNLSNINVHYLVDIPIKLFNFFSGILIIFSLTFLLSQQFIFWGDSILKFNLDVEIIMCVFIFLKIINAYFIYQDISDYRQKINRIIV